MRSSSLNAFLSCPHRYFLEYVLSIGGPANFSAQKGTTFHKVMELLNKKKLAFQLGNPEISEGDDGTKFKTAEITTSFAIDWAYNYYAKKYPDFEWSPKVLKEITKWVDYTLESSYDPAKLDIFKVEHFFEFEINQPWADYEFLIKQKKVKGRLKVRGTLDCLIKHNDNYLEYLDYKSGRYLYDWNKGREKTIDELHFDPQLLIYYYSLRNQFPEFPDIGMTLFYTKGGPCPVQFGPEEYIRAENLIKDTFEKIKVSGPDWIYYDSTKNHQCTFCSFAKILHEKSGKSMCKKYHDEIVTIGMDKVVDKYINVKSISNYVGGGAVRNSE